ncbi:MAG: putative polymerase subfamily sigma factor [Acidimicrobiales bacterium]|nr:putative polymerase subfamily sigma factor [Acidimicrobiales bacterium]
MATFAAFFAAEYGGVVRVLAALTGDLGTAEDLTQDAFLVAQRRWDDIAAYDRPEAWVRRVALNMSMARHRRLGREARALLRLRTHPVELPEPADEVWAAVRTLPARQAQVIALVYGEDRAVDDVAAILGCGVETVRTHLRRARARLAELLREEDDDAR